MSAPEPSDDGPSIMTVRGPIAPEALGFALMHEHLFTRFWEVPYRFDLAGMPEDTSFVFDELDQYRDAGGAAVVDMTPIGINRDPEALRDASERSGLHVVMAVGWYRDCYFPATAQIERRSVDDLARELIDEIDHGVGETGIRPGIIGEIGTEKPWISPTEERVHRAAARAAVATGLPLMTHSFASDIGRWQLDVLAEEGLDPRRVVIAHADTYRIRDYHLDLLSAGASIEFDTLCWYRPVLFDQALDMLAGYIDEGYADQLLVSMDNCKAEHLQAFGGKGFIAAQRHIIPGLRARGIDDETITKIWVTNPQRMLTRGT